MSRIRLVLGTAGILLGLFGVFRLATQVPVGDLVILAVWLIGALVIHDGIVSPIVVGVGWTIARLVPPRARRYLQAGLIAAAIVTVIAIPMIYRRGSQPRSKAILQQNYGANLTVLIGVVAAVTLLLYAVRIARDQAPAKPTIDPVPTD
jgi:hypothetical protein